MSDHGLPALFDAALDMACLVDGSDSGLMLPTALEGFSVAAAADLVKGKLTAVPVAVHAYPAAASRSCSR